MVETIGWTISQWLDAQRASTSDEGLSRIVAHVATFSKDDPAFITIASQEFLSDQWNRLHAIPNAKDLPLYGVPFAPKDNIDVAGLPTTVACPAFKYEPTKDAVIIQILKAAGAIPICKTNLDQFATGLVGTRSPYGAVPSAFSDEYCSGGSSSGSANAASRGLAPFALATDTAGSVRVPAMHNNLIGLKPTRGALSATGVVPACKDLDCVSVLALNLPDAKTVFSITAKFDPADSYSRPLPKELPLTFGNKPKFAIPDEPKWFEDTQNAPLWEKFLQEAKSAGIELVRSDFSPMYKIGACLYEGPWVAERYTVVRKLIETEPESIDPIIRSVIQSATKFSAADQFDWEHFRRDLVREIELKFAAFDGFLVPTAPIATKIADVRADPFKLNSKQGTYTNFVNLADFAALAIPAGFRAGDGQPFGVTLVARKHTDYALLELAQRILSGNSRRLGHLDKYSVPNETDVVFS
ncbi:amidase signature domain-containing protein [Lipomyces japonicus]|uniref:amidase signature domain-containing protein n=1 Tax=Lipomyces japonicus TaxID=56871 RepID=UPI0034CF3658